MVKKAKLAAADRDAAAGRLRGTTDYGALRACDFIIEAATEEEALKLKILRQVDAVAKDDAIVATNTSSISITKLGTATKRPPRFVGVHFFNPVPIMALVEVVRSQPPRTSTRR
jgi:3-hydroxybutyryl-CoA dehydrogenase